MVSWALHTLLPESSGPSSAQGVEGWSHFRAPKMQKAPSSGGFPLLRRQDDCTRGGLAGRPGRLVPIAAVCALCTESVEKRVRAEQAWREQKAFQDALFRFQDWLWAAEVSAASASSSQVSHARSKKELQRFEVLQKQVLEKLMPLEDLNRQFRQLVRTGGMGLHLRSIVQEVNRRWDDLQRRAAAIYKRLKYFVSQWEEFESERETIRLWLMELDLRLTDVEHFSGGTSLEKMIQLQAFQEDVQSNAERLDHLLVRGECLIQKSQPEDAEVLEEELQELSCFCQEVFRRVFHFRRHLVSMRLVFEDEWLSDRESDLEADAFTEGSLGMETPLPALGQRRPSAPKKPPQQNKCLAHNVGTNMDLEWDPSVDVGGSTSHDEEDSSYYSAITGESPSWPLHPSNSRLGKGAGCQVEPMGFDPKRVESWLGQTHRQKLDMQLETEQVVGLFGGPPLPATELQFPVDSQRRGQEARWQKLQQQTKKKFRATPIHRAGQACKRKQTESCSGEIAVTIEKGYDLPQPLVISAQSQKPPRIPTLLSRLMLSTVGLLLLLLLASTCVLSLADPSCIRTNGYTRSFHLVLKYINGPPPT